VFVDGNALPEQASSSISSPRYVVLGPQSGARRVKIDIEYTEDSRLLPVHIEHNFTWVSRVTTHGHMSKGEHFSGR